MINQKNMLKYIRISILLALCVLALDSAAQSGDVKLWSEGELTWDDFQGIATTSTAPSSMSADLVTVTKDISAAKAETKVQLSCEARMMRDKSVAGAESRTPQRLRYHQLQFDLLEYYRRCLQNDINSGISGVEVEKKLSHYRTLYANMLRQIDSETAKGADDAKLRQWESNVQQQISDLGIPGTPEVTPGKWSYGFFAGVGGVFPLSDINSNFKGAAAFNAGLTVGYRRFIWKIGVNYAQPRFNNYNIFNKKDESGRDAQKCNSDNASNILLHTTLGFSVLNTRNFAITPFAGVNWTSYRWHVKNLKYEWDEEEKIWDEVTINTEKASLSSVSWIAGIDFDFRVHRVVSSTPFFLTNQREEYTSGIRLTPFLTYGKFPSTVPGTKGLIVGITLSYTGIARSLIFKH